MHGKEILKKKKKCQNMFIAYKTKFVRWFPFLCCCLVITLTQSLTYLLTYLLTWLLTYLLPLFLSYIRTYLLAP